MAVFRQRTCIQFVPRKNQEDYISIENGDGCFSSVGKVGGRQRLSLKRPGGMKLGIIQHEFIHALGFYHEQSRSDRDKYVRINWENIKEKHRKLQKLPRFLDTPYDYGSIMHYGKHYFAIDRDKETITPIPDASVEIGQRKKMSKYDISKINLYSCFKHRTRVPLSSCTPTLPIFLLSLLNLWLSDPEMSLSILFPPASATCLLTVRGSRPGYYSNERKCKARVLAASSKAR
ncbi:high choriolytic enzyme 1-like protein [Lates japonicus]|uniref:Metalloendopeptidase n=1 Tax=Lates japonicus TaxID=270547 RepID=A0AAD3NA58_LATJO|nr:high choriolytic enzyme 1-like protein [Lates japonicus]